MSLRCADPRAAAHGQGAPAEDLLYDAGGRQTASFLYVSATMQGCFIIPISVILKTSCAAFFGLKARTPIIISIREKGDEG